MMRKIDTHVHLGKLLYSRPRLTVRDVLNMMDELDVEKSCIMAIDSPEELDYYFTTDQVLRACKQHPDRLIPFCNVDPRHEEPVDHDGLKNFDPFPIIERYVKRGCKGFGEILTNLWIDDYRLMKIYKACGQFGLPIVIHIDKYRNMDDIGLPRFEKVLQGNPDTNFIAHAQHWWSEISADVKDEDRCGYADGPVTQGGRADQLLQQYDNLYADLSANSGRNAIIRDPEFTKGFFTRNQDKLLYGSDLVSKGQVLKNHEAIHEIDVDDEIKKKIYYLNSRKLLKI